MFSWLILFLLVVIAYLLWSPSSSKSTRQGYQANCALSPVSSLSPSQTTSLLSSLQAEVNDEVARNTAPIKMGFATLSGLDRARLTSLTLGEGSGLRPCTSSCVCQPSTVFKQGATLQLRNAVAMGEANGIQVSFLGGLGRITSDVKVRASGINATLETDCKQQLVLTEVDVGEVEILSPDTSSVVGKALAKYASQKEQLLSSVREQLVGKVFTVPSSLTGLAVLCKE